MSGTNGLRCVVERQAYIYEIRNTANGKRYIGSTVDYKRRWVDHRNTLRHGRHHSFVLQKAWNKYGESAFKFNLLLICGEADRIFYETSCMKLQSYNVSRTPRIIPIRKAWERTPEILARMSAGVKKAYANPEVREKLRQAHLGRIWPRDAVEKTARSKWKPVYCPELGCSFLSQKHAAEHLGVKTSTISMAIQRKGKVAGATLIRVKCHQL